MIDFLRSQPWWFFMIFGMSIGYVVGVLLYRAAFDGVIHVTQNDDKDTYLFEFLIPPEKIPKIKNVMFRVKLEKDDSQKLQGS